MVIKIAEIFRCDKCQGCGQVSNTPPHEPWSFILEKPLKDCAAVVSGAVAAMVCPKCDGSGEIRMTISDFLEPRQETGIQRLERFMNAGQS